jgi:hypothetical protein
MTLTTPTGRLARKHLFHNDAGTYQFKHNLGSQAVVTVYDAETLQTYDASISRVDRNTVGIEMSRLDWDGSDNLFSAPLRTRISSSSLGARRSEPSDVSSRTAESRHGSGV